MREKVTGGDQNVSANAYARAETKPFKVRSLPS